MLLVALKNSDLLVKETESEGEKVPKNYFLLLKRRKILRTPNWLASRGEWWGRKAEWGVNGEWGRRDGRMGRWSPRQKTVEWGRNCLTVIPRE